MSRWSMIRRCSFRRWLNHSEHIRQDVDMVTLRLNYRFGGPVIAKY